MIKGNWKRQSERGDYIKWTPEMKERVFALYNENHTYTIIANIISDEFDVIATKDSIIGIANVNRDRMPQRSRPYGSSLVRDGAK